MANEATQIGNAAGVAAVAGQNINGGSVVGAGFDDDDMDTLNAMDARLTTIGYTAAQLRTMSYNDKMYALRVEDAPGTLN